MPWTWCRLCPLHSFLTAFVTDILVLHSRNEDGANARQFFERVVSTYGVTLLISAALLVGVDRFDLLAEPIISLKRTILVAFPASFAATVVDSMR